MKFPKELSIERLSLLSKEDREIYESEHRKVSDKNSYTIFSADEIESSNITESCGTLDISEDDMNKCIESIVNEEVQKLYDELMSDVVSIDECNFEQIIDENLQKITLKEQIFEAEGWDAGYWVRGLKLGWLGTMAAAGLGMLGTGIAYLITAGKDKLAMEKLKYYMNRLVELTD